MCFSLRQFYSPGGEKNQEVALDLLKINVIVQAKKCVGISLF